MKHFRLDRLVVVLAIFSSACASLEPSVGLEVPVASKYIWRGVVVDDHPVIQPDLSYGGESDEASFYLGVWNNVPTSEETDGNWNLTEVDPYVDYGHRVGPLWMSVGLANYRYPRDHSPTTTEAHVTLSYEGAWLKTAFETWYDFVEADGAYFNLNVSRSFQCSEKCKLDLLTGLGYMDEGQAEYNFGVQQSGLSDFQAQVSFSWAWTDSIGLTLIGAFSSVIDQDLRSAVDHPDVFWVALGPSFGF